MTTARRENILVVDDEAAHRDSLRRIFDRAGYAVEVAENGAVALAMLRERSFDVLLTDLVMPRMDGVELLKAARTLQPSLDVVMMTAYGTVENAVNAMRDGAYDFIVKPVKRGEVLACVARALERQALVVENRELRGELAEARGAPGLIGTSAAVERLVATITQVAPSHAAVLLVGETGTGKEACARALHHLSPRSERPFVAVSAASMPEAVLEKELLGDRGSVGPDARPTRLERAHQGTLFIDEVGHLPMSIQVKLLRVLEEGVFENGLGDSVPIDVRVIAATDVDLLTLVADGRFREDLLYRIDVVRVNLPALRERPEDIPLLSAFFLKRFAEKHQKRVVSIEQGVIDALLHWNWPGNVRELERAIERAVVLCPEHALRVDDLPEPIRQHAGHGGPGDVITFRVGSTMEQLEKAAIDATLKHSGGDKGLTAKLLGISLRTLYRRLGDREDGALVDDEDNGEHTEPS